MLIYFKSDRNMYIQSCWELRANVKFLSKQTCGTNFTAGFKKKCISYHLNRCKNQWVSKFFCLGQQSCTFKIMNMSSRIYLVLLS